MKHPAAAGYFAFSFAYYFYGRAGLNFAANGWRP